MAKKKRKSSRRRRAGGGARPPLKDVLVTSAALGFVRGKATGADLTADEKEKALFNKVPEVAGLGREAVIGIAAYFMRKKSPWINALSYSALCSAVERMGAGGFSLKGEGDEVSGEVEID